LGRRGAGVRWGHAFAELRWPRIEDSPAPPSASPDHHRDELKRGRTEEHVEHRAKLAAKIVLPKPFKAEELLMAIDQAIAERVSAVSFS
jgi:hypothetical protein